MLVLIGIGFLAGVITAISPCVLPVLPIILAGSRPAAAGAGHTRSLGYLVGELPAADVRVAAVTPILGVPPDMV